MMQFSFFPDVLKILPELMLALLAIMVVVGDLFSGDATEEQRFADAASTTALGLGLVFILVMFQGGFVVNGLLRALNLFDPSSCAQPVRTGFLTNVFCNLQSVTDPTPGANNLPNNVLLNGALIIDNLLMLSRLLFIGAALITSLLVKDYGAGANPAEFFGLLLFATIGMDLMAGAGEMITAYLALELASVSLYIMAGYFKGDLRSSEAGIKYYIFGALSSGILLYGLSLWYGFAAYNKISQPTTFAAITTALSTGTGFGSNLLYLALVFIIAGLGYKIAVVPFHSWSPDVYQGAPTPVTAFLATASKTSGFILLYRVLVGGFGPLAGAAAVTNQFGGWASILAIIAFLTMTYGNLAAITQTNAKRLLAYSSISHAGFLLLGLMAAFAPGQNGAFTQFGVPSLMYYLIAYIFTNLGAFGALGAIQRITGGTELSDLNGLYKRNLGLTVLMAIFVLSLAGIPPLSGFWGKFLVFQAAWEGGAIWLVVVAVLNTIISLYYYLRILKHMFMTEPLQEGRITVPFGTNFSIILSALVVFILGLFPQLVLPAIEAVTQTASR